MPPGLLSFEYLIAGREVRRAGRMYCHPVFVGFDEDLKSRWLTIRSKAGRLCRVSR